ncbi:MAG: hypothetical protein IPP17_30645 [Bacteroidetes bacterium]|nr:hypothetical protein [Bacteroidota bacterium]
MVKHFGHGPRMSFFLISSAGRVGGEVDSKSAAGDVIPSLGLRGTWLLPLATR